LDECTLLKAAKLMTQAATGH